MQTYVPRFFKVKYILILLTLLITQSVKPQIILDTIQHRQVGPGMQYSKYVVHSIPWSIDVFEADMTNQYFAIETVKAYELLAGGREKTSSMSIRRNFAGHWSVGAINGDFFDLTSGMPNNIQVELGEVLRNERADWPTVGFNVHNKVSISKPYLTGKLILGDTAIAMNGLNIARDNNSLIFYNQFYGASTGTSNSGYEATISPINLWLANDTVVCVVDSINLSGINSLIPDGKMIVSASGTITNYLSAKLHSGDTVKILLSIQPSVSKLKEMMGGHPIIVKDGSTASMDPNDPFVYNRHPRTAVGINQDTTKLFLVTVDGRQTSSLGMNLYELADLMLQLGVYQAINLDGGGSTTMVIRNGVVNSPSDVSGERPVSNALLVVSKAPTDSLSQLQISPKYSKIFIGKQVQFSVIGSDQYYNPVYVNPAVLKYKLSDSTKGTINSSGLFTANLNSGECIVIASYGSITDSALVVIKGVNSLLLSPKQAVTDKNRIVTFTAKVFDTDSIEQTVPPQSISWFCTDTTVGKIDLVGQFKGNQPGTAKIIASYFGKSDTAKVRVEIGYGTTVLDSIESLNNWFLTGENIDTNLTTIELVSSPASMGDASIKLDYAFTYQSSQYNWAYLNTDNVIYGVPDSIMIDVKADSFSHRIFFDVVDNENKLFRISPHKLANNPNYFETIRGRIVSASNVYFPLVLKKISIVLGSSQIAGQSYNGTIYLDNLRVKYPQSATSVEDDIDKPVTFMLYQNYPNPFNPTTKIKYSIPALTPSLSHGERVILQVYDVLGREVVTLINEEKPAGSYEVEFSTNGGLSSGLYIYTLKMNDYFSSRKMILLK